MRVDTALLCEAATTREGLLYVLGGGVTRTQRPEFPSPLGVTLALRILMHPTEIDNAHQLQIRLLDADGAEVVRVEMGFGVADPEQTQIEAGEEVPIVIPWDFPGRPQLPHPGRYSMEILIDGVHQTSVSFTADEGGQVANEPQQ